MKKFYLISLLLSFIIVICFVFRSLIYSKIYAESYYIVASIDSSREYIDEINNANLSFDEINNDEYSNLNGLNTLKLTYEDCIKYYKIELIIDNEKVNFINLNEKYYYDKYILEDINKNLVILQYINSNDEIFTIKIKYNLKFYELIIN